VFQNAAYETSDDFINSVLTGVSLVNEALQISYVESVGVRTLDAIIPAGEADLKRYLLPQLIGFFDVAPGALKHSILEGVSEYGQGGQLVSRVVIMRGALGMPIDLMPMMLAIDSRFTKIAGVHAVLDNDCAIPERFDWDDARVRKNLQAAKAGATKAFYQAVTKEALNEWK
jgi:uncharacterized protein (TIGR04255 family)